MILLGKLALTFVVFTALMILGDTLIFNDKSPEWFKVAGGACIALAVLLGSAWALLHIWGGK